jgi:hypothetical protein
MFPKWSKKSPASIKVITNILTAYKISNKVQKTMKTLHISNYGNTNPVCLADQYILPV